MAFNEKYVTVTGGGLHDGSSEANAWTFAEAYSNHAAGDRLNIKAGTYNVDAVYNAWVQGSISTPISLRGYKTTIGDLDLKPTTQLVDGTDRPLFQTTNSSYYLYFNRKYYLFENITFESSTARPALYAESSLSTYNRIKFIADPSGSLDVTPCVRASFDYNVFLNCFFDGSGAYKTQNMQGSQSFINCYFSQLKSTQGSRFLQFQGCVFNDLIDGIEINGYGWSNFAGNTCYNITNNAFTVTNGSSPSLGAVVMTNNVFHTVGGDAIKSNVSGNFDFFCDNNLFYNVTGNNYSNNLNLNRNELVDTSDPFTDAAGGDYSLVSGSKGYNAAQPSLFEGLSIGSNRDIGAIQHADPSGGGGSTLHPLYAN